MTRAWILALVLVLGCGPAEPTPWSALRVVVDTDVAVPDEIDEFSLVVTRGGAALFDKTFDQTVLESLPDSMVVLNEHPSGDSPEKQLETVPIITISVVGTREGAFRVGRSASLRFDNGQLQLPLPMCAACLDEKCDEGTTCKHGRCVDAFIGSTQDLPQDEGALVSATTECGS